MKRSTRSQLNTAFLFFTSFLFTLIWAGCSFQHAQRQHIVPPKAKQIPKELTIHGHTRIDKYFWLRERENPEVITYLQAENDYKDAVLKHTKKLQEKLYKEIIGRFKQTDMSVPYRDNGYYYYIRYEEGQEHPIYCRKKGSLEAQEEIMLNVNEMAKGHDFYQVVGLSVSDDNKFLAFGVDTVSRRKYTIYFKNLETNELLPDALPNTSGGAAWASDNKTVFYATKDSTLRPFKIMRHILGTDPAEDAEVFHEKDSTFSTYVYRSKSKKYILINSTSTLSTEYRYLEADDPTGLFTIFNPRERDHEYSIEHFEDKFYIVTNWNAKNFRLMETPVGNTNKKYWREVIPHRNDVLLEDIEVFKNYLAIGERKNGLRQIRVVDQTDGTEHYLDFGEPAYTAYASINPEFDTELLRYGYTSLTTPNSTYDYNMRTREKTLLKQEEVLGGFDPKNYKTERLYATAKDSVKIPISLVYRVGLVKDGNNPLLLYGYGSYGASTDASFSSVRLSLLDRGFVYAIAHIRGGQEMGRQWYEDGKLLKKKNTFTDFIACAECLIAEKFTNPEKLFAMGGSAGGLLIGAVVNMRPDLFKGVIAAVPWVDVVTTMLDESIPLTTNEFDEWGNPKQKEYYDYMLSYSPYDNVVAQNYPNMFVTTGLHDSQVQYWEPAKWVAKLRELKTDNNILVLHTDMKAGHGGKAGRFERHRLTAMEYAFMLDLLGIRD
ncbi:MAG: S9 family peptidase [candidate division KSB1 bacterium]|nr:S9 family peptidase [candidate division KSB1 bacterium]MDZ7335467.1 S9 family peptidase [candidate division KSB1 bacterium]MDZ7357658.1 S9 family peptidase [candidate division KSB1 bacterium]MDZ7399198.1 S9 family peptidase [candidate division KSB1 bacterium]